jgi:hypothetical protein
MDSHAALDRGTIPMISSKQFKVPPLNIKDSDIAAGTLPQAPAPGLTDMSMSVITHEAMLCHKMLSGPPLLNQNHTDYWK